MLLNQPLLGGPLLGIQEPEPGPPLMAIGCRSSSSTILSSDASILASVACELPVESLFQQTTFANDLRACPIGGDDDGDGEMSVVAKIFASTDQAAQATALISVLTAVSFDASIGKWVVWEDTNNRRAIGGFVYPTGILRDKTLDVYGDVLMRGMVHYDAIFNQKTPAFTTALLGLRAKRLWIQGLPDWR